MYAHHGSVTIEVEVGSMFDEVVQWAASSSSSASPAADDLVVIGITDCGSACDAVKDLLTARNITYVTSCADLKPLTAATATAHSKLPGGGSVMAIFDCWQENYVPANACSGYGSTTAAASPDVASLGVASAGVTSPDALAYTCYNDSHTKAFPVKRMTDYIDKV